jgi:hypothetical protein
MTSSAPEMTNSGGMNTATRDTWVCGGVDEVAKADGVSSYVMEFVISVHRCDSTKRILITM